MKKNEISTDAKSVDADAPESKSKLNMFIMKHKMVFFLLLVIIVLLGWALIKIAVLENKYEKEKAQMITMYEVKIDSVKVEQQLLTSKVFAWAIRSELLRDNKEQVNQFFLSYIHEKTVKKLMMVDAITSIVDISTDKADEGTNVAGLYNLNVDQVRATSKDSVVTVVSPIMGLNNKIGTLIIEYAKTY